MYYGDAPVFVTAPEDVLTRMAGTCMGEPSGQWSMLLRRLKIFKFAVPIPEPGQAIHPCARCFANFIMTKAHEWRLQNL